jgi:hypothetical protein
MIDKQANWLAKAKKIHGDLYDYSLVVYVSPDVPVIINCPIHGQFHKSPNGHTNKKAGCPKCGYLIRAVNNREKYGVDNPAQLAIIQQKKKQTVLARYGVEYASQNENIQNKTKQTNLAKYGHQNIAHGTKKEKVTHTNLEKYGGHPRKNKDVQEKQKRTNLERYGYENAAQSNIIQNKIKQTNLERYGVEYASQNNIIKEKIKQTNLERYGTQSYSQQHLVDILPLLEDYGWLFEQYITQNKTATQIANELGNVYYGTIISYLMYYEIEIQQYYWSSYKCRLWIAQQDGAIIEEWKIPNTRFRADGYCEATNTIYEFHGDYWHGNPSIYQPDEINEVVGKSMGELYLKTLDRESLIKSLGYNLVVVWEHDFDTSIEFMVQQQ